MRTLNTDLPPEAGAPTVAEPVLTGNSAPRFRDYAAPRYWPHWLGLLLMRGLSFIPLRLSWLLSYPLGLVALGLHHGGTIQTNIDLCFPELSARERQRLRRRYYIAAAQSFLNVGIACWSSASRIRACVSISGWEHYRHAQQQGKNVILLAPHMLGLELGWTRLSLEAPMVGMYRKATKFPLVNHSVYYHRTRFGGRAVERYDSLRPLLRMIREGRGFYYLPDQDPDRSAIGEYVFAPFFRVPAATFTALGRIARLGNAVVIPCFTRMLPRGRGYVIEFSAPLENYPVEDNTENATIMNQAIELGILKTPEQYLWAYRRFKTRPHGETSPYRKCCKAHSCQ